MKIFRGADVPFAPSDGNTFTGRARSRRLAADDAGRKVAVYHVEFEEGARTHWHAHSGPQWLLVVEGRVRVQTEGQPAEDVEAGDAVAIAPGKKHWHGAAPGSRGAHLAVNVEATTTWMERVEEGDYRSR